MKGYGLELMGTLGNANAHEEFCPEWARSGQKSRWAPIPTQEAWRRYVQAMVGHYKDQIKYWEIINEPNTGFWAKDYIPLMVAAYEEAKKADPGCVVVGICGTGDQEGDPLGYMRAVAEAGGLTSLDIASGHGICKTRPWMCRGEGPSWDYVAEMTSLLKRYAPNRNVPIRNTEGVKYCCWSGLPNVPHTTTEFAIRHKGRNASVSQGLAAAYVARDCAIEFCGGLRVLFLWQFRNEAVDFNLSSAESLGSVDFFAPDGTPQAKFVALNALAEKLRGAKPVEHFGLSPQVRCAVFDSPSGPFALLWRENRNENDLRSYTLPVRAAVEVQDLFGRPLNLERAGDALPVRVSENPVYLIGEKASSPIVVAAAVKEAGKQAEFTFDTPLKNELMGPLRFARQEGK